MVSYGVVVSILVMIFGLLIVIFPKIFMHVFRGRGLLQKEQNTLAGKNTFYQEHGEKKAILYVRITGIIFTLMGIAAYLHYGFGLI